MGNKTNQPESKEPSLGALAVKQILDERLPQHYVLTPCEVEDLLKKGRMARPVACIVDRLERQFVATAGSSHWANPAVVKVLGNLMGCGNTRRPNGVLVERALPVLTRELPNLMDFQHKWLLNDQHGLVLAIVFMRAAEAACKLMVEAYYHATVRGLIAFISQNNSNPTAKRLVEGGMVGSAQTPCLLYR